jgi:ribosome-associated protein
LNSQIIYCILMKENKMEFEKLKKSIAKEIHMDFVRSAGPGGQNVNKVASAVQLRFRIADSACLSDDVKARMQALAGSRVTTDGELIIQSRRHRTQQKNREDALIKFHALLQKALIRPKSRHRTKPPVHSNLQRLEQKHHRSEIKRLRRVDESE